MANKYTIQSEHNHSQGLQTYTLASDLSWCYCTSTPKEFNSATEARAFFFASDSIQPVGGSVWVTGPRGGFHRIGRN